MRNVENGVPQFVTCYTQYINLIPGHVINPHDDVKQMFSLCRQPQPNTRRSMAWIGSHSLRKASVRYMGIQYFITHPGYKVSNNGYVNDLALVRLKKKITFSKDVAPVRLPNPSDTFSTSSNCWIIGWGNVGTNGMSSTLTQPHRFTSTPSLPPPHSMMHVCRSTAISWNPSAAAASHHPSGCVQAEVPWADWQHAVCRRHEWREGPLRSEWLAN